MASRSTYAKFLIIALSTFMAALDGSIVNVSIPTMMLSFGKAVNDVEWVASAYMISFAASMPFTTWLRERVGKSLLFGHSILIFTFASLLCGLAPTLEWLILARVLQAIGAGAITPSSMALIAEIFRPAQRAQVLGWWGFVVVLGPSIGPTLGGVMTEHWGWPSIFLVNVPIGLVLFACARRLFPAEESSPSRNRRAFSWRSFASLLVFLVSTLYVLSQGPRLGFFHGRILMMLVLVGLSAVVIVQDRVAKRPAILDLSLLRVPLFAHTLAITLVRSLVLYGTIFLTPLFLQGPRGLSETQVGLILGPGSLVTGLMMPLMGRAHGRFGARFLVCLGGILLVAYCFLSVAWELDSSPFFLGMTMVLRGIGIGFLITPLSILSVNAVATEHAGTASALVNLTQQIAGALGVALFSCGFELLHTGEPSAVALTQSFRSTMVLAGIFQLSVLWFAMKLPNSEVAGLLQLAVEPKVKSVEAVS